MSNEGFMFFGENDELKAAREQILNGGGASTKAQGLDEALPDFTKMTEEEMRNLPPEVIAQKLSGMTRPLTREQNAANAARQEVIDNDFSVEAPIPAPLAPLVEEAPREDESPLPDLAKMTPEQIQKITPEDWARKLGGMKGK